MEAVLSPIQERSDNEIVGFVQAMLGLLKDTTTPSPKGGDAAKKIEGADWAAKISEEYDALHQLIDAWQAARPSWQTDLLRAQIEFAWAKHQLGFVELEADNAQARRGEKKATVTDAPGYRAHMEQWSKRIQEASTRLLDDTSHSEANRPAFLAVLSFWFNSLLDATCEPAYPAKDGDESFQTLLLWSKRFPDQVRGTSLDEFAQTQLERLDAPPKFDNDDEDDGEKTVSHEHRRQFVSMLAALVGDRPAGGVFKDIENEYHQLAEGIQFYVVPDNALYEEGGWTSGALPTFTVESDEFGVWFTLTHTDAAWSRSGGFHRYSRNGTQNFAANDYPYLSETERTRYAEDFQRYLEHQASHLFEVISVAPHTRPEVCRTFQREGVTWRETPLYYAVLRPRGGAFPAEIPPLRLDLDFGHPQGRIVVPFHSQRVPLRPGNGDLRHVHEVELRQNLNDLRKDQGELKLTITSESLGLPPRPHRHAANLPPPGYLLREAEISTNLKVLPFPGSTPGVRMQRSTTYLLHWQGTGLTSTFQFPTYPSPGKGEPWKVDNFLVRPGQIKERHVPGGQVDLYGLPWHWGHLTGWLSKALAWGGTALGGGLGLWLAAGLFRRLKPKLARPFPLERPVKDTPLAAANFLRRLGASREIGLPESQLEILRDDVEKLENLAGSEDPAHNAEAASLLDKWFKVANDRFASQQP